MSSQYILRIPRSDLVEEYVLVSVTTHCPLALDLDIVATEGVNPYTTKLKHSQIQNFRAKASQLDAAQWEELVYGKFLRRSAKSSTVNSEKDGILEMHAAMSGEQLAIIFRRNISGIMQRLGEIPFIKNELQEIDSVYWALTAALRCDDVEREKEELQQKYEEQRRTIQALEQQLEELIVAKEQHETAMLEKFRDILNAKKLKIRDQQRLLTRTGTSDKEAERKDVPNKRHESLPPRNPKASTSRKRKAKDSPPAALTSATASESDQSAVTMQEPEEHPIDTPERSDASATEDEDENEDDDDHGKDASKDDNNKNNPNEAEPEPDRKHASHIENKSATSASQASHDPESKKFIRPARQIKSPPPRRDLPFTRAQSAINASTSPGKAKGKAHTDTAKDSDDDETSDDEL